MIALTDLIETVEIGSRVGPITIDLRTPTDPRAVAALKALGLTVTLRGPAGVYAVDAAGLRSEPSPWITSELASGALGLGLGLFGLGFLVRGLLRR